MSYFIIQTQRYIKEDGSLQTFHDAVGPCEAEGIVDKAFKELTAYVDPEDVDTIIASDRSLREVLVDGEFSTELLRVAKISVIDDPVDIIEALRHEPWEPWNSPLLQKES